MAIVTSIGFRRCQVSVTGFQVVRIQGIVSQILGTSGKSGGPHNGGAKQAAEKQVPADNHPVARRATPPDPGGELLKTLPSSVEEGWRAERRGGCNRRKFERQGVYPQRV